MPSRSRALLIGIVLGVVVLALAQPVQAAETSNSEFVIIPEGDVFPEDLYAGAIRVIVEGTLEGDLIAFAAEEVVINGTVTGSVTAVSPKVTVGGEIGGSLRVTGNRLEVTGDVAGDLVAAVFGAELGPTSTVSGDVILWAWNASLLGEIGADLSGSQRNLELAGSVGGDVDVSVTRLRAVGELHVAGDLGYRSPNPAEGLDLATVDGTVVDKTPLPPNLRVRALTLLGRFLVILLLAVAALTAAYGWPRRMTAAISEVSRHPVRRWLPGALILFSPLFLVGLTALILGLAPAAAAFPLLVVLIPLILASIGAVLAIAVVAGAPVVGWLGGVLFEKLDLYGSILTGSVIAGAVWYLPVLGWVVPVLVLPLGLGAWIASLRGQSGESLPSVAASSNESV
ncbi:MAG TPA: polymer-forming cytoskeletal protein [Acidimicrobiia bacterium]|nr:polymer-forming cytoskeletal protein [Acidimicrobiia bacterium]